MRRLLAAVLAVVACLWSPALLADEAPAFGLPLDCRPGIDCFVQNYVDHDPGPGAADYTCGTLTYDGLTGTDIRLPDYVAMERGVEVRAAADGVVLRTRDGVDDISVAVAGAAAIAGREAGNSVIVDHGGGWETQYSHMRKGSIAVEPGQRVKRGERVGLIGLSGNTEFPHVNFVVRHDGQILDPFVGEGPERACGPGRQSLWAPETAEALAYVPTAVLIAGFATGKPDLEQALRGGYPETEFAPDAPAIVFWIDIMGAQAGDRETIAITGPDGAVLATSDGVIDRPKAQWFRFVGLKRPGEAWPLGTYTGTYILERSGGGAAATATITRQLQVR